MAEHSGSLRVIIAAIAGNVAIAIRKFIAALITGSAAMYSESVHSTGDTGNEVLLLFGMRRVDKPADAESVILQFDPQHDVEGIKPKAFRLPEDWAHRGEMTKSVLSILRQALEPMTMRDIALEMLVTRALNT